MKVEELSILDRMKTIIPSVNELTEAMQAEHKRSDRIKLNTLIIHASLVDLFEQINQIMIDTGDVVESQSALALNQHVDMNTVQQLAKRSANARTMAENQDVFIAHDWISIAHIFNIVDLDQSTEAARHLERDRVFALISALQKAVE